ncbi:hypothetical protein B5G43_10660 [Flavonifractor sp. An92]|uniref:vWA domain-containing protein n=1 Tax=Flavonifractor sp. An92 TaxID=1965666 RepID=UPI000B3A5FA5|nr:VWA domain-containing protein [Flavonifractor sp. An92]OUN06041.1 hypothetical protein B5G43_10660 [Flavonifractor sp. An92]
MNYNTMLTNLKDLVDNPTPRIPVALCLDVSGSMFGKPMEELNTGVTRYLEEVRKDELALSSAETALVTFGDTAQRIADFDTADRLRPPVLEADGITDMGAGLALALDLLEQRKKAYQSAGVDYYQPILVVMSDGAPNGDPRVLKAAVVRIQEQLDRRKLTVVAVGLGPDADLEMLSRLSRRQAVRLSGTRFREFFLWLSRSVASVSATLPGEETSLNLEALQALSAEPWPEDIL